MASLTIKGLPDALLAKLRARAAADRRSMNKEVIHLLGAALSDEGAQDAAERRLQVHAQVETWTLLAGRWQSDVDLAAEVNSLYAARSGGRAVDL